MKRVFLLLLLFACTASFSQTITQIDIENKVKRYLIDSTKDYTPIAFDSMNSIMTEYFMTIEYKLLLQMVQTDEGLARDYIYLAKLPESSELKKKQSRDRAIEMVNEAKKYMALIETNREKFKPWQLGYQILHKYRARDQYGLMQYNSETFYLDTDLNLIDLDSLELPYSSKQR